MVGDFGYGCQEREVFVCVSYGFISDGCVVVV